MFRSRFVVGNGGKASVALWPMMLGGASITHGQGPPPVNQGNIGNFIVCQCMVSVDCFNVSVSFSCVRVSLWALFFVNLRVSAAVCDGESMYRCVYLDCM